MSSVAAPEVAKPNEQREPFQSCEPLPMSEHERRSPVFRLLELRSNTCLATYDSIAEGVEHGLSVWLNFGSDEVSPIFAIVGKAGLTFAVIVNGEHRRHAQVLYMDGTLDRFKVSYDEDGCFTDVEELLEE